MLTPKKGIYIKFPFYSEKWLFSRPSLRQSWSERSPACILSHQRWVMACHQPGMGHLLIGLGSDPFRLHFISFIFSKQVWFFFALIQVAIFKVFNVNALVNDVFEGQSELFVSFEVFKNRPFSWKMSCFSSFLLFEYSQRNILQVRNHRKFISFSLLSSSLGNFMRSQSHLFHFQNNDD